MSEIRALTVSQPWAWAIVSGYKDVENRKWRTTHEGRFLIHAGKRLDPEGFRFLWEIGLHKRIPEDLPLGRLIGSVRLVDVVERYPSAWAQRGAWHWVLDRPREFRNPLPVVGKQKLFVPHVNMRALGQAERHATRHHSGRTS